MAIPFTLRNIYHGERTIRKLNFCKKPLARTIIALIIIDRG